MRDRFNHLLLAALLLPACAMVAAILASGNLIVHAQEQKSAPEDFFTQKVQPIFNQSCYGCHTTKAKGGLRLDSAAAILRGGDDGQVIVPGDPTASMLSQAIHYRTPELQMPPKHQLPDDQIAIVDEWITKGALMPVDAPPADAPAAAPAAPPPTAAVDTKPAKVELVTASVVPMDVSKSPAALSAQEQYFEEKVRPLLISKCYACHGDMSKGGLSLNSRADVLAGGVDGPVVVPGHPESSKLITAVHYEQTGLQMPPARELNADEIAILEQWVRDGLNWPAGDAVKKTAPSMIVTAKDRSFWSYQKPVMPQVPAVSSKWAYNDIDKFVLAKLNEEKITPVHDTDKRTLIRRVTYDLTGLPPTPEEVDAFLKDHSAEAYPKLVDRLLASKAYGERWGRMWLDVVRYSDTTGEGADYPVREAYKYRDYVVQSFAEDKPYDRFIKEQIAGDLMPSTSEPEHWNQVIATGYLANTNHANDPVADAVDNIGHAFLGTTVGCARCHDHKFDPIPTADYYGIYGILASSKFSQSGSESARYETNMIYRDPTVVDSQRYKDFQEQLKPIAESIRAVQQLPYFDDILPALEARRMALFQDAPEYEQAYGVAEGTPHDERIQKGGEKRNQGDIAPRHFLQVLGNADLPAGTKGSGRLQLADWIASPENPITARVMVNRIWQGNFGRGIVDTPNDFGVRGDRPSNQALLDYLAVTFMKNGWSVKQMQRMILLSHTYQLSDDDSDEAMKIDPDNNYMWRHTRQRMDAEQIRDTLLATSGTLDTTPAGPHPFPPEATWNWSGHKPFKAVYETNRRTLYVMVQRSRQHPYLGIFDGADPMASTPTRETAVSPLQALYFMNAAFPKSCADALTKKLAVEKPETRAEIEDAFEIIYSRPASKPELDHAAEFVQQAQDIYEKHGIAVDAAQSKAMSNLVQALYASNELMFLD